MNIYGWYRKRLTGRRTRMGCRVLTGARKDRDGDLVTMRWSTSSYTHGEHLEVEMTREETEELIARLNDRLAWLDSRLA